MSAIQVKNVPEDLHERLRKRARAEGRNLGDYVLKVLRRDLSLPSMREWLEEVEQDVPVMGVSSERIVTLIHEGRAERDAQVRGAVEDRD